MERWNKVKQVYQAALVKPPAERDAFVNSECAGDDAIRREVESLLAYQENVQHFMEEPAIVVAAKAASDDSLATSFTGRQLGHYKIVSLLGAGGMGEVYLAEDTRLERQVALKILPADVAADPDRMERFAREAKASSALNHPNVATIYDIGESDGVRFIAMEHVEGRTLAQMIGGQAMEPAAVVDIGAQIADALEAAHGKGIIHRDIKPANLMMNERGQVKVLDFGIAKMTRSENRAAGGATTAGLVIGSMPYVSPEQVLGRETDARSDIFSLGVSLYEMAAGRLPFEGKTTMELLDQILHAQPGSLAPFNDRVPSELERIIRKCLEKDIGSRYQSARDLLVDLRNLTRWESYANVGNAVGGGGRRHNLPVQLTSFIGRVEEISEIHPLISSARLVTLTGAGGCGKTRLALQAAAMLLDQFRDGVWLVDLAPLTEPNLVMQSAASVLKLQEGPRRTLQEVFCEFVRHRHLLLVLDNCEHLIAACAELAEVLLKAGANLRILATSREALGVPGETVWRVPSLSSPPPGEALSAETLLRYEGVLLFRERASAIEPAFKVTESNVGVMGEICRRLDGIPLAIELAAARLKVLSVEQINAKLKDRFRLLTGGSRTALARQRTLEATVDWSYELLSEPECLLLCRLSVFAGGWTLEAAEEVCSANGIEKDDTLDLLSHLVDKSLVNVEDERTECKPDAESKRDSAQPQENAQPSRDNGGGDRRYRFLETVRQYGRERLVRSGDAERMRDRHLTFCAELVRRAEPELRKAHQVAWLNRLQLEYDNVRTALEWCLAAPQHSNTGLELAAGLTWFWTKRGYFADGQRWLERALATSVTEPAGLRAKALIGLSIMTLFQGDYPKTLVQSSDSLSLGREAGDLVVVAFSLFLQGVVAEERGDLDQVPGLAAECQAAAIASGDLWVQAHALELLAIRARIEGDYARSAQLYDDALGLFRRTGDIWCVSRELVDLGQVRVLQGHFAEAKAIGAEGIALSLQLGDSREIAWYLEIFAGAEAALGDAERAARLWGASDRLLESVGSPLMPDIAVHRDRYLDTTRNALGDGAFQAALSEGRAMSVTEAVHYALQTY